jgi:hypothetical protein
MRLLSSLRTLPVPDVLSVSSGIVLGQPVFELPSHDVLLGSFGSASHQVGLEWNHDPAVDSVSERVEWDVPTGPEEPGIDDRELRVRPSLLEDDVHDFADRLVAKVDHDAADQAAV